MIFAAVHYNLSPPFRSAAEQKMSAAAGAAQVSTELTTSEKRRSPNIWKPPNLGGRRTLADGGSSPHRRKGCNSAAESQLVTPQSAGKPLRRLSTTMRKASIKRQVEAFRNRQSDIRSSWVVDPRSSKMMGWWDAATTLCLVFTALVTPLEVGFFEGASSATDPLFLVNRLVDIIFAADLVLNFSLMYSVKTPQEGVRWVDDHRMIACHYLLGWFLPDFLSVVVVTFDIMALNKTSASDIEKLKLLRILRVLRLIKLVRLARPARLRRPPPPPSPRPACASLGLTLGGSAYFRAAMGGTGQFWAALGGSTPHEGGRPTWRPATASSARARRLWKVAYLAAA